MRELQEQGEVTGVDASELAVHQAQENAKLNGLDGRVKFICEDVLNCFRDWKKRARNMTL